MFLKERNHGDSHAPEPDADTLETVSSPTNKIFMFTQNVFQENKFFLLKKISGLHKSVGITITQIPYYISHYSLIF